MNHPLLPDTAPFPVEHIAALNGVMAGTSAEQRTWLSGFLAGYQAAATAQPAAAAAPAAKTRLAIIFATESGNAETLADQARKAAGRQGFAAKLYDAADLTPADLPGLGNVLLIASTWGEGDPPQRAAPFYTALLDPAAPRMEGLRFGVLALGDQAYTNFCEVGRRIDERLAELGAVRVAERADCDLDYQGAAKTWIGGALEALRPPEDNASGAVIHVDFGRAEAAGAYDAANPFAAEITELVNLNSSRSGKQTFHVELSLAGSGIAYEPGDAIGIAPENDPAEVEALLRAAGISGDATLERALAEKHDISTLTPAVVRGYAELTGDADLRALAADAARLAAFREGRQVIDLLESHPHALTPAQLTGLLRPLPARLYSVASSRKAVEEEAHLLVGVVRYETHGRARTGVTSGLLSARRKRGDVLRVHLKPNRHFRLPADPAVPVIMIGPGTGVAPFRAFLQEREAVDARGKNWLFFGDRQFTHDFLYQLEWQDHLASGRLTNLDVAFSRDQPAKRYVQHVMWERRAALHAWLADGAHLYLCGDQTSMAGDVHDVLRRIVADQQGKDAEHAEHYLAELKRAGRYLLDVY